MTELLAHKLSTIILPCEEYAEEFESLKNGIYKCSFTRIRNPKFHRKYFALLKYAFDNWPVNDGFKNFDVFRENVIIMAGYYVQAYDLDGNITLKAKSIKFASMDDTEFELLYSRTIDVIVQRVLQDQDRDYIDGVVLRVIGFC